MFILAALLWPQAGLRAGSLDLDPILLDPGFNGGAMRYDRFGGNNGTLRNSGGQRVLHLDDGSYIVAALVDAFGAETGTITGVRNIGLVHFSASGQKIAWPNVSSSYTDASHNYIVVPNRLEAAYLAIRDIKVFGSRIYVLADHAGDVHNTNVRVLAFGLDGSYHGVVALISDEVERGVGMVFVARDEGADYLLLVTSHTGSTGFGTIRTARYLIDPVDSSLALDTAYGNNGFLLRAVIDCSNTTTQGIEGCSTMPVAAVAVYADAAGNPATNPAIFIAGNYTQNRGAGSPVTARAFVMRTDVDGGFQYQYGSPNLTGSYDGVASYDLPDAEAANWVQDLVVRATRTGYEANVLHGVHRSCGDGFNVAYIAPTGLTIGKASSVPMGGATTSPCVAQTMVTTAATRMILDGNRLLIVGTQSDYFMAVIPERFGWIAVVDWPTGYWTEMRAYQAHIGGDVADSSFLDIIAGSGGRYFAVGNASDPGNNHRDELVVTGVRADRIFGGSFGYTRFDD